MRRSVCQGIEGLFEVEGEGGGEKEKKGRNAFCQCVGFEPPTLSTRWEHALRRRTREEGGEGGKEGRPIDGE